MNQLTNYLTILTAIETGEKAIMATSTYARYAAQLVEAGVICRSDSNGRPYVLTGSGAELLPRIRDVLGQAETLLTQIVPPPAPLRHT